MLKKSRADVPRVSDPPARAATRDSSSTDDAAVRAGPVPPALTAASRRHTARRLAARLPAGAPAGGRVSQPSLGGLYSGAWPFLRSNTPGLSRVREMPTVNPPSTCFTSRPPQDGQTAFASRSAWPHRISKRSPQLAHSYS